MKTNLLSVRPHTGRPSLVLCALLCTVFTFSMKPASAQKGAVPLSAGRAAAAVQSDALFADPAAAVHLTVASDGTVNFTDDLGRAVSVRKPQRVAVLQGSLAGIWLTAGGTLAAATSDAFTEPEAVTKAQADILNAAWHTGAFSERTAGVIPEAARPSVISLGAMMTPNAELLAGSSIDFVIMSANISGHKKLQSMFETAHIPAAYFNVETFADYLRMLRVCSAITGDSAAYEKNGRLPAAAVAAQIQRARAALGAGSAAQPAASGSAERAAPRVLLLRAFSAGASAKNSRNNMTGTMLADLGCVNIADSDSSLLEDVSMEQIIAENPDYIFVTTMGASHEKAVEGLKKKLASSPAWASLSAVKNGRLVILPRALFHYKPDEQWADCYAILNGILYDHQSVPDGLAVSAESKKSK